MKPPAHYLKRRLHSSILLLVVTRVEVCNLVNGAAPSIAADVLQATGLVMGTTLVRAPMGRFRSALDPALLHTCVDQQQRLA